MTRAFLFCACVIMLGSCTQRLVCPAYQSAFIFDKKAEKEKFLYYNDHPTSSKEILASKDKTIILPERGEIGSKSDSMWSKSAVIKAPSLPQVRRVKKDRYLLLPEKTYKKALKALRTVEMKPVYPKKVEDSTAIKDALDSAARSITDTLTVQSSTSTKQEADSVYAITKTKERYNADQDIYMWYLRDILVLPDVRAAMQDNEEQQKASKGTKTKKGVGGFFKNLFKKKKNKSDSASLLSTGNEADSLQAPPKEKKKGLGGLFKKKNKSADVNDPKKKADPAKKEEDDGF